MPIDLRRSGAHVYHALSIYRLALAPGIPSVLTVYDVIPLMWPERYLRTGLVHRMLYSAARRGDWLIAISEAARRDVIEHLQMDPERVEVILLAADERYRPVDPAPALARLGVPSPYLLYVGGLANDDPRKGVRELIDGYAEWWRAGARAETLVLAGRLGPAGAPLVEHARRTGAPIHFTDFVPEEDMPGLYSGASCLVTASRYEGFGLPALEAVACGTPVVGYQVGALPEAAGPGGLLVPDGRIEALIEAVQSVCDDPQLRTRLSAEGRRHAAGFSWRKNAEKTWDVYERAAGRR